MRVCVHVVKASVSRALGALVTGVWVSGCLAQPASLAPYPDSSLISSVSGASCSPSLGCDVLICTMGIMIVLPRRVVVMTRCEFMLGA